MTQKRQKVAELETRMVRMIDTRPSPQNSLRFQTPEWKAEYEAVRSEWLELTFELRGDDEMVAAMKAAKPAEEAPYSPRADRGEVRRVLEKDDGWEPAEVDELFAKVDGDRTWDEWEELAMKHVGNDTYK